MVVRKTGCLGVADSARQRFLVIGVVVLAILPAVGCRALGPQIPVGYWAGEGTVVYTAWGDSQNEAVIDQTTVQRYPTDLRIGRDQLDGRDVLVMEILSERRHLPKLDDETHLRVALQEVGRPTPEVTLYRVVAWQFNPKPNQALAWEEGRPPVSASAIQSEHGVTVEIRYMERFVDTLYFEGNQARKSGVVFSEAEGFAHWSEKLRRLE